MKLLLFPWFYPKPPNIADDVWAIFVSRYGYESILVSVFTAVICWSLFRWVEPRIFTIESYKDVFKTTRPWWKYLVVGVLIVVLVTAMRGIMISGEMFGATEIGVVLMTAGVCVVIFFLLYWVSSLLSSDSKFRYTVPLRKARPKMIQ